MRRRRREHSPFYSQRLRPAIGKHRVFVQLIREKGREWLAKRLLENQQFGIQYGWQKDYDGLDSPEAIRTLLETGNRRNRT